MISVRSSGIILSKVYILREGPMCFDDCKFDYSLLG